VNKTFQLGIDEKDVNWDTVCNLAKNKHKWSEIFDMLKAVWDSEWYFEVRGYRNFAHRAFLFVQFEYDEKNGKNKLRHVWLEPAREGQSQVDALEQSWAYLDRMYNALQRILNATTK
jgi:hypothetical protein